MMSHGWQIVLLLFISSFLTACGTDQPNKQQSFPMPLYADPTLVASAQVQADLKEAMSFWEAKAGHPLFDYKGTWGGSVPPYSGSPTQPTAIQGNVIFFQNPWPLSPETAGQTTVNTNGDSKSAFIMINPDMKFCEGDCINDVSSTSQKRTFTHELGHFLGLQHASDTRNIMYPVIQPGGTLSDLTIDDTAFQKIVN